MMRHGLPARRVTSLRIHRPVFPSGTDTPLESSLLVSSFLRIGVLGHPLDLSTDPMIRGPEGRDAMPESA
jgi:hypothetical protein